MTASTCSSVDLPQGPAPETQGTVSMLAEEENYPEPGTLQEELNEIVDAFYELSSDEDIRAYQCWVEDIEGEKVAENALMEPALAPVFELEDQDGDTVRLSDLLEKGPVVLSFYRGKWCPHCNATLMRYGNQLVPELEKSGATLVAISPMLPDGTAYLATKRDLNFAVCSDTENQVAKQFGITFAVRPHTRPFMLKWGDDLPQHNGLNAGWEIPLPATYVIGQDGNIAWSFLDNDPGVRAEVGDILQAVADASSKYKGLMDISSNSTREKKPRSRKMFNRKLSTTFPRVSSKPLKRMFSQNRPDDDSVSTCSGESHELDRCSQHSVKSEGGDEIPRFRRSVDSRRRKRTLRRNQSAKEFLGRYFLTPSE
ncbi:Putative peroxiredoxin bcp [Seminavis robusta]|uniref:thioredoxin-dependent peroxiredoxin n=1 Tax=Seminavis robusta TaxID=568900 RepID=A0A9N8HFR7_9STRA|nr:Putative peroxiredoxin bcp [Seminavis robusta]|eukprot:Sro588_g171510.1 Putative peroxiredoxin bcp (369) ;mRNA; f:24422-25619